jgi:5-hydroxyisourate hydrolase-like protein (transthyretin family)
MLHRVSRIAVPLAFVVVVASLVSQVLAEPVQVAGQAVDAQGKPVAGVTVTARYLGEVKEGTATATTDAQGHFTFELNVRGGWEWGDVVVYALVPGQAVAWTFVSPPESRPESTVLKLGDPATNCTGIVTDAAGQPVGGAEVWVRELRRFNGLFGGLNELLLRLGKATPLRAQSGADGRFTIPGLPAQSGPQVVAQTADGLVGTAPFRGFKGELRIVVGAGNTINGRLTAAGQPLAGVKVWLAPGQGGDDPRETVSDAQGVYRFEHLLPDFYDLAVIPPEGLAGAARQVYWRPSQTAATADFSLTPGALVSGTVTDSRTRLPLAGAQLLASDSILHGVVPDSCLLVTDAEGKYSVRLPAANQGLQYLGNLPGYPPTVTQYLSLNEGQTRTGLDLRLSFTARLRGQVLLPDGTPAAGARVKTGYWVMSANSPDEYLTVADGQGRFETRPLQWDSPDPYVVWASDPQRNLAAMVWSADQTPLEIRLAPGAYMTATAATADGKPASGVKFTLMALSPDAKYWECFMVGATDATGKLRLGPLPPGVPIRMQAGVNVQEITMALKGDWDNPKPVTLVAGEDRALPPLVFDPNGRTLRGTVVDEAGAPVPGAQVASSGPPVTADAQGKFELPKLPMRGALWIIAAHPTKLLIGLRQVDPSAEPDTRLVLRATGTITGRIIDEAGQPVAGGEVRLDGGASGPPRMMNPSRWLPVLGTAPDWEKTDADGRFRRAGVPAGGDCWLLYYAPGKSNGWSFGWKMNLKPGQTIDVGEWVSQPNKPLEPKVKPPPPGATAPAGAGGPPPAG